MHSSDSPSICETHLMLALQWSDSSMHIGFVYFFCLSSILLLLIVFVYSIVFAVAFIERCYQWICTYQTRVETALIVYSLTNKAKTLRSCRVRLAFNEQKHWLVQKRTVYTRGIFMNELHIEKNKMVDCYCTLCIVFPSDVCISGFVFPLGFFFFTK